MSVSSSTLQPQSDSPATPTPWFRPLPEDGWMTLVFLAAIVYVTVSSIQAVTPPWAPGLQILTFTAGIGLVLGYLVVQQGRLPAALAHLVAIVLGVAFAFDQTAGAVLGGDRRLLISRTGTWFHLVFVEGRGSDDNAVFLLFLGILTFLLAYISYWLVEATRRPWLAVLANGAVLLINLNWATDSLIIFLVMFLLATMLLLVRFTLAENMRRWRARGLRFSPDLSWDFMQAGAILAVVVLLLAYTLPIGTANSDVMRFVNDPQGAWQRVQLRVEGLFGGVVGPKGVGTGVGLFGPSMRLVGKVDLPDTQILHYTVNGNGDPGQYLISQTLDTYDGISLWTQSQNLQQAFDANAQQPASSTAVTTDSLNVTFDTVYGDGQHSLVVPGSEPASFSIPTFTDYSVNGNVPTAWEAQRPLPNGQTITAAGYVSKATAADLQAVPYPAQVGGASKTDPYYYSPEIQTEYLPPSGTISPEIRKIAQDATRGTTNMYDAAVALEDYLRTFTYSTDNPEPPPNQDATVWFLHQKQGYCTFFASAMALMGRSLGMPTRIASGFIDGDLDFKSESYVVRGTASHAWTQVYFARYGWVNFEPTSSFGKFLRSSFGSTSNPSSGSPTPHSSTTAHASPTSKDDLIPDTGGGGGGVDSPVARVALGGSVVLLLLLLGAALALVWWRLLFRGLSPAAAAFGRVTRLGRWAGAPPQSAQTPLEYSDQLSEVVPAYRSPLRQLSTAYAHERYGGEVPEEVASQLPSLYDEVRHALTAIIRRRLSVAPLAWLRTRRTARRRPRRGAGTGRTTGHTT